MESLFKLRTSLPAIKEIESFEKWEDDSDQGSKKVVDIDLDTCPHCFNSDCLYSSDLHNSILSVIAAK